jgi:hypothetical protein
MVAAAVDGCVEFGKTNGVDDGTYWVETVESVSEF